MMMSIDFENDADSDGDMWRCDECPGFDDLLIQMMIPSRLSR